MAGSVDAGEGFRRRMASAEQLSGSPDLSKPAGDLESSGRNQNTEIVERTFRRKVATKSRDDGEGPRGRISAYPKAELEKELLYLPDPLKLAENTLNLLRQDEHIKALEIVRYASRKMPCTVSWNHIIDYDMSKGRVTPAMKTYNEMKKRAQPPDAYTYTILLRGLAANHVYPQSLPRALSIYNSMYAENSPVRPSIIHTNAVLKVCSRANDIDSLFGVAANLPKRGKGAPDNLTFTTIINAIWHAVLHNPLLSAEQHKAKRQEAVRQGRRMWEDIIGRWRNGDILVDEDMVCALARLLILGETQEDYDDVLSLFEQTMRVPRMVPRLGDRARQTHFTPSKALALPSPAIGTASCPEIASHPISQTSNPETDPQTHSLPPTIFAPLPLTPTSLPRSHPRPSHQTLSALISACTHMHAFSAATAYWTLLASPPHPIRPDADNTHTYLRLLRLSRASRLAASLLTTALAPRSAGGFGLAPQPKTFRIAMSACVRDARNPAAPAHAAAILAAMVAHLEEPDLRATEMFLDVLQAAARNTAWRPLLAGLAALDPVVANLRSVLSYGSFAPVPSPSQEEEGDADEPEAAHRAERRGRPAAIVAREDGIVTGRTTGAVLLLLRRVVGLYDRVLGAGRESLSREEANVTREKRGRLSAFVERRSGGRRVGGVDRLDRKDTKSSGEYGVGGEDGGPAGETEAAAAAAAAAMEDEEGARGSAAAGMTKKACRAGGRERRAWEKQGGRRPRGGNGSEN